MAYRPPQIGTAGLSIPTYSEVLSDAVAQYRNIYGQTAYLDIDSADYQYISIFALKLADAFNALQLAYNARSPLTAVGAALDGIVKVNGIARKVASASTCVVTVTGANGAVINNGIVKDIAGYLWALPATVTIGATGNANVIATCATPGSIAPAIGDVSLIATPQAGWTAVTNSTTAIVGQPIETDAQLRARQALSVAAPAITMLAGTTAQIAAVSGVARYNIIENPTNATDSNGTPAHSITCVVEGGADADIASAIYLNRGIGCYTNGSVSVTVTDVYTNASMPIRFTRPSYVPVYVSLSISALAGYTSATPVDIKNAIATYLNSLQIGQTVVLSELYGAALSVRPNANAPQFSIRSLTLGASASPSGTNDLAMTYAQVAQGVVANIVTTLV